MRRRALGLSIALGAVALTACSRGGATTENGAPSASAATSTKPIASAVPDAAAATSGPSSWSGHYTATVGSLTIPAWTGVRFRGEDASIGLGDGTMTITLDPNARANGTLDGALGATKVDGALHANDFSATLVPEDLATGFSGTAIGTRDGDHIAGTMRLSLPQGNVVREASFTLDRKP